MGELREGDGVAGGGLAALVAGQHVPEHLRPRGLQERKHETRTRGGARELGLVYLSAVVEAQPTCWRWVLGLEKSPLTRMALSVWHEYER